MITIEHEVSNPRNRAMMIPMGVYKNIHIADIKEGDFLKTKGKDGSVIVVERIKIIPIGHPSLEIFAHMLYNTRLDEVIKASERIIPSGKISRFAVISYSLLPNRKEDDDTEIFSHKEC